MVAWGRNPINVADSEDMEIKPLNPVSTNAVCLALFLPSGETRIWMYGCPLRIDPIFTVLPGTAQIPSGFERGLLADAD